MKKLIKLCANHFGYEITKKIETDPSVDRVSKLGNPKTVIDVGVGYGTPWLYHPFDGAKFILVEPVSEYEQVLKEICHKYTGSQYCVVALGEKKKKSTVMVDSSDLQYTSFLERSNLTKTGSQLDNRTVEITTLDHLKSELSLEPPYGLKIDTEGFELEVIKSGDNFLKDTQFVIVEVSILKRFHDSYSFEEFIAEMHKRRFHVFDILQVTQPEPVGTRFLEIAFLNSTMFG